MASLLGITVALMIMLTFMYSSALGALAGILVAPIFVCLGRHGFFDCPESLRRQHHWRVR